MLTHGRWCRHTDRGDTLVELLVALVIVGFAVVALIGGLMTSTATSSTHRSLVTLDGALRAFGTSLRSAVSNQLGGASSTSVAYQPCASTYQFAGAMYPETQAVGGYVSIPVMGFAASKAITATIGASSVNAGTSSSSGGVVATFSVPNLAIGTYAVSLGDGTGTNISAGSLTVGSTGNSDALAGQYSLSTQVTAVGSGPCSSSHLQQAVLTLANTQVNAGAADSETVYLADNRNISVPAEVVSAPSSPQPLGSTLTFTATLTGSGTTPTGSVTWTFPNSPAGTTCASGSTTTPLSGGSASCTVGTAGSPPVAGTYTAVAVYSGDLNYSGTSAESDAVTVSTGTVTVTTSTTTASPAQIGSTLSFTATVTGVTGITPTGSVVWTWPGAPSGAACVGGNTTTLNSGSTSCSVTPALLGTYKPTATYQADSSSSYSSGATGNQASVTVSVLALSSTTVTASSPSAATGSDITFTATVTGSVPGLTPTGQVKWTFQAGAPSGASCSGGNVTTLSSGSTSCVVKSAAAGTYTPTAAYQGDSNYSGSSGSQATVVVGNETPTLVVTGTPGLSSNGSQGHEILTFTATVTPTLPTDPHPTGTVSWTVSGGATSCTSTTALSSDHPGNTSSATCVIDPSVPTSNYTATATYSGDAFYNGVSGSATSPG